MGQRMAEIERSRTYVVPRRSRWVVQTIAGVLVLGGWLLASPPGASPDDGYHLAGIWCARGYDDARCVEVPSSNAEAAFVPEVLTAVTCTAFDNTRSAACVDDALSLPPSILGPAMSGNIRGERPGLYYATMHVFVSDDFPSAFARIRTANALTVLLMVGLTAWLAAPDVRRAVLVTWLVASVPLGLFLVTSLNTTAWGLIGIGTLWANTTTLLRVGHTGRRAAAGALALIGATMAAGARTEGPSHVAVAVGAVIVWSAIDRWGHRVVEGFTALPRRSRSVATGALALLTGAALVVAVRLARRTDLFEDLAKGWTRLRDRGLGNPLVALSQEIPELWTGGLGDRWGLGWLDTPMPPLTSVTVIVAYTVLVALGLQHASRGRVAAAGLLLAAMFALPLLSLLRFGLVVQEELQPRHYLPVLFVLLGIALSRDDVRPSLDLTRGTRTIVVVGLGVAHAMALLVTQRRYTSGLAEIRYVDLERPIEWWWTHAPAPTITWAISSLAYLVLAWSITSMLRESRPSAQPTSMRTR